MKKGILALTIAVLMASPFALAAVTCAELYDMMQRGCMINYYNNGNWDEMEACAEVSFVTFLACVEDY